MWKILEKIFDFLFKDPHAHDDTCACAPKIPGKLKGKRILIDPGHGLYRKTTNGGPVLYVYQREDYDGIREDLITVKLARYLVKILKEEGADIVITRKIHDERIGVSGKPKWKECAHIALEQPGKASYKNDVNCRWQYANNFHKAAPSSQIDLFLSIHFNSGGGKGCETWYYKGNEKTQIVAKNIQDSTVNETRISSRGIKPSAKYAVLKHTDMAAIIWEGAFFDSQLDRDNYLKKERYYAQAARGICKGLIKSVEENLI